MFNPGRKAKKKALAKKKRLKKEGTRQD